jgi:hypothetical protein
MIVPLPGEEMQVPRLRRDRLEPSQHAKDGRTGEPGNDDAEKTIAARFGMTGSSFSSAAA